MPTASIFLVIPLGHEGCRQTHLVTNFFDAGFEEHCSIASLQSIGIADVHLVHTGSMFAVVAFDIDIAVAHHTSDASQQMIVGAGLADGEAISIDRKSTRLNSSHTVISYAVFCLKKKNKRLNSSHTVNLVCRLLLGKKQK